MCNKCSIDDVRQKVECRGYKLLSTEYKNNKQKLDVQCDKGHTFQIRYDMFKQGRGCPTCNGTPKYTYEFVKHSIELENYKLLSNNYEGTHKKLDIQCDKGHVYKTSFYIWNRMKHRCPICGAKKSSDSNRYSYNEVKSSFEKEGYKLLSIEYKNNKQKLDIQCNKGHKTQIRYDIWLRGHRCSVCAIEHVSSMKRLSYDEIKKRVEDNGYTLLSTEYINSRHKIDTICPNGHKWSVTWNNFQRGATCLECSRNDGNHTSKAEKDIVTVVKSMYNGKIIENDRKMLINPITQYPLELDIYLPNIKKAIELNSLYWHSKPDYIKRDKEKVKQCKEIGIDLLVIDYDNWKRGKEKHTKIIYNFLNGIS